MKKILSIIITILMIMQVMIIQSVAEKSSADYTFTIGTISGNAGEYVEIELNVEGTSEVRTVGLSTLTYDKDALEFLGFVNKDTDIVKSSMTGELGLDDSKGVVSLGYLSPTVLTGKICDLKFKIKNSAVKGDYSVTMSPLVKNVSSVIEAEVIAGTVTVTGEKPQGSDYTFTLGTVSGEVGEEVEIDLSVAGTSEIRMVGLSTLTYDKDALEFVGFVNKDTDIVKSSMTGELGLDDSKGVISLGYMSATVLNGKICDLKFKIKDSASSGVYAIKMTPVVKNVNVIIDAEVVNGNIIIAAVDDEYSEPTYVWTKTDDGYSVTATSECKNDVNKTITETVTANAVTTKADCENDGKVVYTATFTNPLFETQTKTVVIAAIGHNWGKWTVTTEATCEEKGVETRVCLNDSSHVEVREIPAKGHDLVYVPAKEATDTENGNIEYYYCTVCGKCFLDENGEKEISLEDTEVIVQKFIRGDVNDDGEVDSNDAIYLLRHTMNESRYPINQSGDMNGDGDVDSNDAIYLLRHTMNGERYPLY